MISFFKKSSMCCHTYYLNSFPLLQIQLNFKSYDRVDIDKRKKVGKFGKQKVGTGIVLSKISNFENEKLNV